MSITRAIENKHTSAKGQKSKLMLGNEICNKTGKQTNMVEGPPEIFSTGLWSLHLATGQTKINKKTRQYETHHFHFPHRIEMTDTKYYH